jgi:hypothetical protein
MRSRFHHVLPNLNSFIFRLKARLVEEKPKKRTVVFCARLGELRKMRASEFAFYRCKGKCCDPVSDVSCGSFRPDMNVSRDIV